MEAFLPFQDDHLVKQVTACKCFLFEILGYQEKTRQMITWRVSECCSSEELVSKTYSSCVMCLLLLRTQTHCCHTSELKNGVVGLGGEIIPFVSFLLKVALLLLLKRIVEDRRRGSFQ